MKTQKKCSSKEHFENNAISYCQKCQIYMCNKCNKIHSDLCPQHHIINLNEDLIDEFTGFCKEENHSIKLEYFCKTHNQLCCAICLCKIKGKGNGQHNDCNACFVNEIESEKKNKLKDNMKCLTELSNSLELSISELKFLFEKIKENKEEVKSKIQKIFTKIRNSLNNREDELFLEVDKVFNEEYGNAKIIKEIEQLSNKIKNSLEKGKKIDKEWNNNEINYNINVCISIEDNINEVKILNENIKKCKLNNEKKIIFIPGEKDNSKNLSETIQKFGLLCYNNYKYAFKQCPINISDNRKYKISGDNYNIITKIGEPGWMGTICEKGLEKSKEHKWKIKILKTQFKNIMVGVAPFDFDINTSNYMNCGWYFYCYNSTLYSGPPFNYGNKTTNLSQPKDEITVVMNMKKRTLKFIINNEDKGESYSKIPIDKPLAPAIFLNNLNDSVEIIEL